MRQRKFPWVPIGCSCCHVHAICLLCEYNNSPVNDVLFPIGHRSVYSTFKAQHTFSPCYTYFYFPSARVRG